MKRILAVAAISAAMALVASGCSSSSHGHLTVAKIGCGVSVVHWYNKTGKNDVTVLRNNLKPMLTAAQSHKKGEVNLDAQRVTNASNSLRSHLPPNCVPGLNTQVRFVLTDVDRIAAAAKTNNVTAIKVAGKDAENHLHQAEVTIKTYVKS